MTTVVPGALDERAPESSAPLPPTATAESTGGGPHWWVREGRPAWSVPARGGIFVGTLVLYCWNLSGVGMSNTFYAAAVKSGTVSWKAFLFGSLDPGSFITVDKPPAALWVQELSGRVFGFSSWSMLVPEALAGVACVMIVYHLVRRWVGEPAAVLAAMALAVTPIATEMFRDNNPDAFLTFMLVAAAWALWSALETARTSRLVLCATLVGVAFLTKTLEAFIVLPAFGLVYLVCAKPGLGRRLAQLGWAALALVISSGWWVAMVELWPAASRPYIGGSTNNSELNLIFGYNGFSRIFGSGGGSATPLGGGGGSFGGTPGVLRMFNTLVGGQIAWLLPLALVGLVGGLWLTRRQPRDSLRRAGYILWGGWTLMFAIVFSDAKGIFHPYYTVVLAPGVAALCGAGAPALWRLGRSTRWWCWVLPGAVIGSAVWAAILLGRTPGYDSWLEPTVVAAGVAAGVCLLLALIGVVRARLVKMGASVVATASVLAGPLAYSVTTVNNASGGTFASAGPSAVGGFGGSGGLPGEGGGGPGAAAGAAASVASRLRAAAGALSLRGGLGSGRGAAADPALISFLEKHQGSAEYLVAVTGSQTAAPLILASGKPVIAMGGFSGSDPTPTLAQFKELVASGKVHYVLVSSGVGGGTAPGATGGGFPGGFPGGATGARGSFPRPPGAGAGGFRPGAAGGFPGGAGGSFPGGPGGGTGGRGAQASDASAVDQWVIAHGTKVSYGSTTGGTLYSVTSAAAT